MGFFGSYEIVSICEGIVRLSMSSVFGHQGERF